MSEGESYQLRLTDQAAADLKGLTKAVAERIVKRLRWLATNAASYAHRALTGQWRGLYRLRVGDYRVIYALDHNARVITVVAIGHRSDIYDE
jgi:mRNA interferase RelE/StbE